MSDNLPTDKRASQLDTFLEEMSKHQKSGRGRLAFIIDATASRKPAWDMACSLQATMFEEATRFGSLEVQLIFYRGLSECSCSGWIPDGRTLARLMGKVQCEGGITKIGKALAHVRREHEKRMIHAVAFVGDAMEENHSELCEAARTLRVPLFMFQESDDPHASRTFAEMARLSGGAHRHFDAGAARELGELLRAVAAFATGGVKALQDLNTDSARRLLTQLE
jgi:hypothetical protein